MEIVLIPGFWLDASSWGDVTPPLTAAGHRTYPLTLPGMDSVSADRREITLRDHVEAVVAVIDCLVGDANTSTDKVVLVGHSGGGAIAHAAVDARPGKIARVVYVDSFPLGHGGLINDELPVVDGEIPLPDWSVFEPEDLVDLDEVLREAFRRRAIPTPAHVASDRQQLSDERRYDVPITIIACEFSSADVHGWIDKGGLRELAGIHDVTYMDLPTGHWPQFTRPADLARAILDAISGS